MYSHSTIAVPGAATGVTLAATGIVSWSVFLFAFCAFFAIVGAICALKRTCPVLSITRELRAKRAQVRLNEALLQRQLRSHCR